MTLLCMARKVKKISERTAQRRTFTHSEGDTEKRLTECAQHSDQGTVINCNIALYKQDRFSRISSQAEGTNLCNTGLRMRVAKGEC